ncbi:MAG: Ig-like domain-containing protein [Tannerella sp.]|jgi:hypothetical protein|nr:Ig-like domain-containing protein [Tannerella sp.]
MKKSKKSYYSGIFYIALMIGVICGCADYPPFNITHPPFVNQTSLNIYEGDEVQLTASPAGANFKWASDNEEVAQVSQTGLITAVGSGLATVTVASDDDETKIDVVVRIRIPLTEIRPDKTSLEMALGGEIKLGAVPVPEDATGLSSFKWVSQNPEIATVSRGGTVKAVGTGSTSIVVSHGDIQTTIPVVVYYAFMYDRTNWAVHSVSSTYSGQPKERMLDGDFGTWWHSAVDQTFQYAIIDLGEPLLDMSSIDFYIRNDSPYRDTKTVLFYVGDNPASNAGHPDSDPLWKKIGQIQYVSQSDEPKRVLEIPYGTDVNGRYLKLYFPDSQRRGIANVAEIYIHGILR